jgi:hypothetical protein
VVAVVVIQQIVHVVKIHVHVVVVILIALTQVCHQARLFQIQILSALLTMVLLLHMETSLNYGSRPKLGHVPENIILDPLQSTGR